MQKLATQRASDEERIAIVENDSCAVDAVQVLTGCTFGKGNLFFRDYGKMVFTFASRSSGHALRLALRVNVPPSIDHIPEEDHRRRKMEYMLAHEPAELFTVAQQPVQLPQPARLHDSVLCQCCGEMVMATRTRCHDCSTLCIPCKEERISRLT